MAPASAPSDRQVEIIEIEDTPEKASPRPFLPRVACSVYDSSSDEDDEDDDETLPDLGAILRAKSKNALKLAPLQGGTSSSSAARAPSRSSATTSSASSSRQPSTGSRPSLHSRTVSRDGSGVLSPLPVNGKGSARNDKGKGKAVERAPERSVSAGSVGSLHAKTGESVAGKCASREETDDSDDDRMWDEDDGVDIGVMRTITTAGGAAKRSRTTMEAQSSDMAAKEAAILARQREKTIRSREAAERRMAKDMNVKARSREDRMPELTIEVESSLTTDGGALTTVWADLLDRLQIDKATVRTIPGKSAAELSATVVSSAYVSSRTPPILRSIRFRRTVRYTLDTVRRTKVPLADGGSRLIVEPTTMLLYQATEVIDAVKQGKLLEHIIDARSATGANHQIFVLVIGLLSHFKKLDAKQNRAYTKAIRQAVEGGQHVSPVRNVVDGPTRSEVTDELARLRIVQRAFVIECHTHAEAADWVHNIACDIAIRTDALIDDSHLSFCPDKSARSGKDLEDTFGLMLQQIPQVSVPRSVSIREKYPTIRSLFETFANEGQTVDSSAYKTGIPGDALMKRVEMVFSSRDPLELVNARSAKG